MTLPSSGSISASQIRNEFGASGANNSVSLGNYRVRQTVSGLSNLPLDTEIQKKFIDKKNGGNNSTWIHPDLAIQLSQWINPIFTIQISRWIREFLTKNNIKLKNELRLKDARIKNLEKYFKVKQKRTEYPDENVIYILTTKEHKKNRIYIIGSSIDLKERLGTYNKTCDHEVVYCKSCNNKKEMLLIERMVLTKLNLFKEQANRDRFILPIDNDIKLFTDIIDNAINFFN
jgi:hypothetical protein